MDNHADAVKDGIHVHCAPSTSKESVAVSASSRSSACPPLSPTGSATSSVATAVSSSSKPSSAHNITVESWPTCGTAPSSSSLASSNLTPSSSRSGRGLFSRDASSTSIPKARVVPSLHVNLPSRQKLISVHTLTKENIAIAVLPKCQVWDVFHVACVHMRIEDDRFFGLAMRSPSEGLGGDRPRHEYYFLQFDQKISKYLPKQPRFGKVPTVEKSRPTLVIYLRVRIYIDRVDLIQCPVALHHYYMQLRENLLDQWSGSNSVSAERCWALAALALQTDKGETDDMDYFRPEKYFPLWVINSHGLDFVRKSMPGILKSDSSRRLTQREAMFQFCQEASRSPYALNCHLYGLRRQKNDVADNALIGITDAGIDMWDIGEDGDRSPLRSLAWSKMARLSFDRKRLSIGGLDGSKMSLYAQSETKTRYLLLFCREVHQALLQINLHYANLRPHSSMTHPPGWSNERLVDSPSGHRTASNVHSAQSSMSASACNSIISSTGRVEARQSPSLSVDSKRAVNKIKGTLHPNERRNAGAYSKQRVARPRTPLSFNGPSNQTSVAASEAAASDLHSLNEEDDIGEAAASEIERAMNSAPSPPKVLMSDQREVDELEQQLHHHHEAVREASDPVSNRTGSVISSCTMSSHHSQRSNDEVAHSERTVGSAHEITNAELTNVTYNTRVPQNSEGPPTPMQSAASRSMHDLRTVPTSAQYTNPADVIRQPPRYNDAVAQLHRTRLAQLQEIHQQRSLPEVAAKSQMHPRQPRWTTVAGDGADPDLLDILERMRIQQQQENMQRLQQHNVQTMQQLSSYPYGPSLAKSEPRLNGENGAYAYEVHQQPLPSSFEQPNRVTRPSEPVQGAAQAKRRFASRSPASRGINRVKSLPSAQIAMIANGVARTNGTAVTPPVNTTIAQYVAAQAVSASTPPSYADALELRQRHHQQVNGTVVVPVAEQQQVMARQQQLPTNGLSHAASMEANGPATQPAPAGQKLKNFPMMRMLLEDDGSAMTSSSSSTDGPVIPPCDYDDAVDFNRESPADKYRLPNQDFPATNLPLNGASQMQGWQPIAPPIPSAVPYFANGHVSSTAALAAALRSSNSDGLVQGLGPYSNDYLPNDWQGDAYYAKQQSSSNTQRGEYVFDENLRYSSPYVAKYALGALKTPPPHRSTATNKHTNGIPNHLPPSNNSGQVMDLPPPPPYPQNTSSPSRNAPLVM